MRESMPPKIVRPVTEMLESRVHLSGTSVSVNFQSPQVPVPSGYVADTGQAYGDRGNGFSYGWNANDTRFAHFVPLKVAPDTRYDSFFVTRGPVGKRNPGTQWQIALPNGDYTVHVVAGDGTVGWGRAQILVNGVTAIDGRPTAKQRWLDNTVTVSVTDGTLTIANGPKSPIGRLAFVDINQVVSTGPTPTPTPTPTPVPLGTLIWTRVTSIPLGLSEGMGESVNGKLYVFGGYTSDAFLPSNRVFSYDPTTNQWTELGHMPVATTHTGTAVDGQYIYLAGGYPPDPTGQFQLFSTTAVWRYDTTNDTWSSMPPLPEGRGAGQLALVGRELHYVSGADPNRIDSHSHWALNLDNPAAGWQTLAPIPTARNHLGVATLGGKLYAIGGAANQDADETALNTVEVYDPATDTWSTAAPLPTPRALVMAAVDVFNGYIIVGGGEINYTTPTDQITAYNPTTNTWAQLTPIPTQRVSGIMKHVGNELIYTTGFPGYNTDTWIGTFT